MKSREEIENYIIKSKKVLNELQPKSDLIPVYMGFIEALEWVLSD